MTNKTAGIAGILCAPFFFIDVMVNDLNGSHWTTGLFSVIYMAGWMLSIIALYKMESISKTIMVIQLLFLTIAQVANLILLGGLNARPVWFEILDLAWPASNAFMLITGISVLARKRIQGWKRFIPLLAGLWLPALIFAMGVYGKQEAKLFIGLYSVLAWTLLAILIYTTENDTYEQKVAVA